MRYPKKQAQHDEADKKVHGRIAVMRPGARLKIRGFTGRRKGPEILGIALLTRVVSEKVEAAYVSTKEYGRRWFHTTSSEPFTIVEELNG